MESGGEDGIRTHDTLLGYTHLANGRFRPLSHLSRSSVDSGDGLVSRGGRRGQGTKEGHAKAPVNRGPKAYTEREGIGRPSLFRERCGMKIHNEEGGAFAPP